MLPTQTAFSFLIAIFFTLIGCQQSNQEKFKEVKVQSSEKREALVASCIVCHGVQEAQRGPILNGMENWYLRDQINKFKSGIRGNNSENRSEHLMGIGARIRTIRGDLELGKDLYQRRCASCHGEKGEGNQKLISPSLTHLEGWYFYQQMRKFREGKRGYHPRDEGGRVMSAASKDLSDYDIKNLVAYCVEAFGLPEVELTKSDPSPKPF
jgi:cytochrome c553